METKKLKLPNVTLAAMTSVNMYETLRAMEYSMQGIEFGDGFEIASKFGSEANDPYCYDGDAIITAKNSNGGINGGISNGMPIIFSVAIKPTPSIAKEQKTVNLKTKENVKIEISGRHDPAIVHRARAVVDAMTAIAVADLLATRFGTDFLAGDKEV